MSHNKMLNANREDYWRIPCGKNKTIETHENNF